MPLIISGRQAARRDICAASHQAWRVSSGCAFVKRLVSRSAITLYSLATKGGTQAVEQITRMFYSEVTDAGNSERLASKI